jgi:hypothetical protein
VIKRGVDLQAGKRVGDQLEKEMKIEIRTDEENHHHDVMVNGKPYSRHYDLEKAEQMRDKLITEQARPITAVAHDIRRSQRVSRPLGHEQQQEPDRAPEREIER